MTQAAILPGSTLGMLGGGQLGRMFAQAAQSMGYRVHVYDPEPYAPAAQCANEHTVADYEDEVALKAFAESVSVVSLEFENIPSRTLEILQKYTPVHPSQHILHTVQNRLREKTFLAEAGFAVVPFFAVRSLDDLKAGCESLGLPAVIKTADSGYDGKGQVKITAETDLAEAWKTVGEVESVLEAWMPYDEEASMIVARNSSGEIEVFPMLWNLHADHILDVSVCPAPFSAELQAEAESLARRLAKAFDLVGIICIELFVMPDQSLVINELAPRPHNSGHLTIEATATSQFTQQIRAICNVKLGDAGLVSPAAMANLLGHHWAHGEPAWDRVFDCDGVNLHLYGKKDARPGRKMGHITVQADTPEDAHKRIVHARDCLDRN